jgi:glycosyltransferase involved in cell wall biosynthesis
MLQTVHKRLQTGIYCVNVQRLVRSFLSLSGKGDRKVAAVFGLSPAACQTAVMHVRHGAPGVPVWLYSTAQPLAATQALCERVRVRRNSLALLLQAQVELWRLWVAIGVSTWTGERGGWLLKLAPFTFPPFRALLLNEHGDFFGGSLPAIALHGCRRVCDAAHSGWHRAQDLWMLVSCHAWRSAWHRAQHLCLLISYHAWRSGPFRRAKHVACARSLLVAATLLRWCGYPQRKLFHRLKGQEPLDLQPTPARGAGIARFSPSDSGWNSDQFEEAVFTSEARWLLWHENGAVETVDDLLPLFRDERTFAVSRHEHYRTWKPGILPMAPFRALQPGEACRVLAPLSRTILVDREKLAALGIPRCGLAGTTWLLLFWKAAAAGWVSYSVGQSRPPSRQPDCPLEETAFIFRLLAQPWLRNLRPCDTDLARGTISWRPAPVPAFPLWRGAGHSRPKVLVVSPFLPYPLSHGGAVRIYNLCRALSGRVDFALAAIREQNETVNYDQLHEVFGQVYVVDLDELALQDRRLPGQVRHYQSRGLRALIASLCRSWKPDLLQIEYTQMAAFRDAAPETPALLVEHDITFSLYRQLAASGGPHADAHREYERWRNFEAHWLRRFDGVWTVSEEDRRLAVGEGSAPDRTFLTPNGVDTARFVPREESAAGPEILYVGSFRHLPNILGFDKLHREIMPRVWSRFPAATLRVVAGPDYQTFWRQFAHNGSARSAACPADRRIIIHGFVEDLRPLYAAARVVVAPLEVSAGTNIKVLEAMACGRAVVSTPVGCAGLGLRHGHDALISADGGEFGDAVCELLRSPALRSAIAAEARSTVEERFDWNAIAEQAYRSYMTLALFRHSVSSGETPWRGSADPSEAFSTLVRTAFGDSSVLS